MKILTASDLKKTDFNTIESQGITTAGLMERASSALFEALKRDYDIFKQPFTVFCGAGNNGGDGLVLSRMLFNAGADVNVYLIESENYSDDNILNQKGISFKKLNLTDNIKFSEDSIIIDALFGYGFNRPLEDVWQGLIDQINNSGQPIISIDLPSGIIPDGGNAKDSLFVKAHKVYTFHSPKKAFLLPSNKSLEGSFEILNIGLEESEVSSKDFYSDKNLVKTLVRPVGKFSHKGTFGHCLVIGGSRGKMGAVRLSTKAALRTGCGLITAYIPECGYISMQSGLPEAMVITDPTPDFISAFPEHVKPYQAIGIGVGLGTHPQTTGAFKRFLKLENLPPLVLDADALNILGANKEMLNLLPPNTILTPHPGELVRLIGEWNNDIEKQAMVTAFAQKYNVIMVVKGAFTNIALPDGRTFFNSTGNPGMATAGSGDVLTGTIASLLAQNYPADDAALLGVYLHGLSGDKAIEQIHPKSLTASDIIFHLSHAWQAIYAY